MNVVPALIGHVHTNTGARRESISGKGPAQEMNGRKECFVSYSR
jgi:hypothetical protein